MHLATGVALGGGVLGGGHCPGGCRDGGLSPEQYLGFSSPRAAAGPPDSKHEDMEVRDRRPGPQDPG